MIFATETMEEILQIKYKSIENYQFPLNFADARV